MDNYKIESTQRAFLDITECVSFVKNVSIEAAKQLRNEIMSSINSLSTFPNKYPEIDGLKIRDNKVRKMPIHEGRYVVLYKIEESMITIYDVLDVKKGTSLTKI